MEPISPIIDLSTMPLDTILSIVFLVILGGYVIFTAVLYYHWAAYGTNATVGWLTGVLYLGITGPLVATAGILTLTF